MRVWIENPFDNLPFEGYRPQRYWLMAMAFVRAGHDVTLWTSDFNHTTKRKRVQAPEFARKVPTAGFKCVLLATVPYRKNVSLRRLWSHWRYAREWRAMAPGWAKAHGAPDLIIASSPPLSAGAVARRLARRFGARLVADVQDAWPETFERVAPRGMLAPLRWLARRNYLGADLVTTVADRYIDLVRGYGCTGEVRRFYHGIELFDLGLFDCLIGPDKPGNPASNQIKQSNNLNSNNSLSLVYAGNLGRSYDLKTVVAALDRLPNATLDIAGRGDQEHFARCAALDAPSRIRFHGYLGEAELRTLLERCDIGIVPMAPDSCVGIPYKFADYARAGLAIVSSLGGESAALLERYGAGAAYREADPSALADAVAAVAARLDATRRAARRMAEAEFDATQIYNAYVQCAVKML